jgi:hypothetical protein
MLKSRCFVILRFRKFFSIKGSTILEFAGRQTNIGYSTIGQFIRWGTILFGPHCLKHSRHVFADYEVHDWPNLCRRQISGRLDRARRITRLTPLKKCTQLDILVDPMGRVNFDKSIHDRKGITEKVELVSGNQTKVLKNWTVYNFPVDYSFIKDKKYNDTKILPAMPAYYKSTFKLDKVGDTFLDMSTWVKGMVCEVMQWGFREIGPNRPSYAVAAQEG